MILPARRLLLLLLIPVPILLIWRSGGGVALALAVDVAIMFVALLDWRLSPGPDRLEVERQVPLFLSLDADNSVGWDIRNASHRPLSLSITDDLPPQLSARPRTVRATLKPRGRIAARYTLRPRSRGQFTLGDIHTRCASQLGLLLLQRRIRLQTAVKVYPNVQNLREYDAALQQHRAHLFGLRRTVARGQGRQFECLRDYLPGDEVRDIAWKATARRSRLIVREYSAERSQNILVMLDCGRLMSTQADGVSRLDYAINATLLLTYAAMRQGDELGLLAFSDEVESYMPPTRGQDALQRMNEALYQLEVRIRESNYDRACRFLALRHRKRSLIVIFTDVIDGTASQALMSHMARFTRHHRPLCVTLRNRELERQAADLPDTAAECYVKAAAIQARQAREVALTQMRRDGVDVLDVDPQSLTPAVLSHYLALKRTGRL